MKEALEQGSESLLTWPDLPGSQHTLCNYGVTLTRHML